MEYLNKSIRKKNRCRYLWHKWNVWYIWNFGDEWNLRIVGNSRYLRIEWFIRYIRGSELFLQLFCFRTNKWLS
jgi:hypothetical protein